MPHTEFDDPETSMLEGSPACLKKHLQDEMPSAEKGQVARNCQTGVCSCDGCLDSSPRPPLMPSEQKQTA